MKHTRKLCQDDLIHKKNLLDMIHDGRFRVALFGSLHLKKEDTLYQDIADLTTDLAKSNYDIVTGGGPGAMEAASFGHQRASMACDENSKSIGINIELPFEQIPNKYLDFTQTTTTFSSRLDTFMLLSHVFVVTPGGIGTLLELFYTWQLMQVGHICRTPIILWGEGYKDLKKFMKNHILSSGFMTEKDYELTIQVTKKDEVLQLINMAHRHYENAGENACVNINHYIAGAKSL